MYIVLENEIADVDQAEFEKIGFFHEGVIAVPNIDVSLTIKGMRASAIDKTEDCQNTISLVFEAPWDEEDVLDALLKDPFSAGIIYRLKERDFVELKYEHRLGILTLFVYFLVDVNDCSFGYSETRKKITAGCTVDYAFLWKEGLVRGVKS